MMTRCPSILALGVAAVFAAASPGAAQGSLDRQPHRFWASAGAGYGSANGAGTYVGTTPSPSNSGVSIGNNAAVVAFGEVGTTLSRWVRVGAVVSGVWPRNDLSVTTNFQATISAYIPQPAGPHDPSHLFIVLGPGIAYYHASTAIGPATNCCPPDAPCVFAAAPTCSEQPGVATGTGWGATLGLGYDLRISDRVLATPVVSWVFSDIGTITANGSTVATGWRQNLVEFGLRVAYQR